MNTKLYEMILLEAAKREIAPQIALMMVAPQMPMTARVVASVIDASPLLGLMAQTTIDPRIARAAAGAFVWWASGRQLMPAAAFVGAAYAGEYVLKWLMEKRVANTPKTV